jgi:hypothetical protein
VARDRQGSRAEHGQLNDENRARWTGRFPSSSDPSLPADTTGLVVLKAYVQPFVAQLHAALLEERGIPTWVFEDQVWPTLRIYQQEPDVKLMVPAEQLEAARIELDDIIRNPPQMEDEEPWRIEADEPGSAPQASGRGGRAPDREPPELVRPAAGTRRPPLHILLIAILGLLLVLGTSLGVLISMFL